MPTVGGKGRAAARRTVKPAAKPGAKPKPRRKGALRAVPAPDPAPATTETPLDTSALTEETDLLIKLNDVELLIRELQSNDAVEAGLGFRMKEQLKEQNETVRRLRQQLRDAISPDALGHFDRAWSRYGRALAPVSNGVCCGCFGRLPTSMSPGSLHFAGVVCCPYCARLLYWPPQA